MSPSAEARPTPDVLEQAYFWTFVLLQLIALGGEVWLLAWPLAGCETC